MTNEIKKYIKGKNFLLRRFYNDPSIILNYNEYYNTEEFINFLKIIIDDNTFIKKLNDKIINALFNLNIGNELKEKIKYDLKIKKFLVDVKIENQKNLLNKIYTDDYENNVDCYLEYNNLENNFFNIIDTFFCSNEFLEIIESVINKINNDTILININEIISESINIKEYQVDYDWIYERLPNDKIKNYDVNKAKNILKIIYKKMHEKKMKLVVDNTNKNKKF